MMLKINEVIISDRCSYITKQEIIRIIDKTLDGDRHIQIMGSPTIDYEVTCVTDQSGVEKIREAEALGSKVFIIEKSGKTMAGHIIELTGVEPFGYSAKKVGLILAKTEVLV